MPDVPSLSGTPDKPRFDRVALHRWADDGGAALPAKRMPKRAWLPPRKSGERYLNPMLSFAELDAMQPERRARELERLLNFWLGNGRGDEMHAAIASL